MYITNLSILEKEAADKEEENLQFRNHLSAWNHKDLDKLVFELNEEVTAAIDCTLCGACCRSLMINVTAAEIQDVSRKLEMLPGDFKAKYIEESSQGNFIINRIPCHFLSGNKCSIYTDRFTECREFPHLHKPHFKTRLFGTLMHYGRCPIIYNVIEELKKKVNWCITENKARIK